MEHILAALMLSGAVLAQMLAIDAKPTLSAGPQSAPKYESGSSSLPSLPAIPKGKSTILGGEIRSVDPVHDRFTLKVFGQRPVKILFDERTEVYLDGKRIPLRELRSVDHGSVQTVLDGTDVFALSVHMLSRSAEGEYQGYVLNYDPVTMELAINTPMSRKPFKLTVKANSAFSRIGEPAFTSAHPAGPSDLVKGTLIAVTFEADKAGRGIANKISILATPGSAFVFSGILSSFDLHAGMMVLVDPRDDKTYQISFDSARLPGSRSVHEGDSVNVTATYDGTRYLANGITVNEGPPISN
jgi:hypothetical protein